VSGTNLLGLFPQNWYATAQAVLLPFLVDMHRVEPAGREALKRMILMEPPNDFDPVEVGRGIMGHWYHVMQCASKKLEDRACSSFNKGSGVSGGLLL
jgi:hypothetical protein